MDGVSALAIVGFNIYINRWLISAVTAKLIRVDTTIANISASGNAAIRSTKLTIATMAGMKNKVI
jgi:hypothetical protein